MNITCLMLAATLSTGVEIPDGGIPMNNGWHQYTTRTEKRPAAIADEAAYLKWKWRTNLADPKTGLDNDALRAGVKRIVDESGWKAGREDWYDVAARCFDFLVVHSVHAFVSVCRHGHRALPLRTPDHVRLEYVPRDASGMAEHPVAVVVRDRLVLPERSAPVRKDVLPYLLVRPRLLV